MLGPEIDALKPDPAFFGHCRAVVPEAETFQMWGDDVSEDYVGAVAAGWRATLVGRPLPASLPTEIAVDGGLWYAATLADEPSWQTVPGEA